MRTIILAEFGDRHEQLIGLFENIRKHCGISIHLYGDAQAVSREYSTYGVKRILIADDEKFTDNPVALSNYYKVHGAFQTSGSVMLLDDDMRITSKAFVQGFELAEKFGICVPANPRIYAINNALGGDVPNNVRSYIGQLSKAPALNFSPMFVDMENSRSHIFMEQLQFILKGAFRGTIALWIAALETGIVPLILPEQWCVCGSNAEHLKNYSKRLSGTETAIEPMLIHYGHRKVREVFPGL